MFRFSMWGGVVVSMVTILPGVAECGWKNLDNFPAVHANRLVTLSNGTILAGTEGYHQECMQRLIV